MKRFLYFLLIISWALTGCFAKKHPNYHPSEGDLVFQSFPDSPLTSMIEGATDSPWSHCGIVFQENNEWLVIEAIGPVKKTPLQDWINRSRNDRFCVYQLNDEYSSSIPKMIDYSKTFLGLPYDIQYEWDDSKIYCSELIYKSFEEVANQPLGQKEKVGDLNWRPFEHLIQKINEGSVPVNRELITPKAITKSDKVHLVYPNSSNR